MPKRATSSMLTRSAKRRLKAANTSASPASTTGALATSSTMKWSTPSAVPQAPPVAPVAVMTQQDLSHQQFPVLHEPPELQVYYEYPSPPTDYVSAVCGYKVAPPAISGEVSTTPYFTAPARSAVPSTSPYFGAPSANSAMDSTTPYTPHFGPPAPPVDWTIPTGAPLASPTMTSTAPYFGSSAPSVYWKHSYGPPPSSSMTSTAPYFGPSAPWVDWTHPHGPPPSLSMTSTAPYFGPSAPYGAPLASSAMASTAPYFGSSASSVDWTHHYGPPPSSSMNSTAPYFEPSAPYGAPLASSTMTAPFFESSVDWNDRYKGAAMILTAPIYEHYIPSALPVDCTIAPLASSTMMSTASYFEPSAPMDWTYRYGPPPSSSMTSTAPYFGSSAPPMEWTHPHGPPPSSSMTSTAPYFGPLASPMELTGPYGPPPAPAVGWINPFGPPPASLASGYVTSTASYLAEQPAGSAVASTNPFGAPTISASSCAECSEHWNQANQPATASHAPNPPANRRRRGANAFLNAQPEPIQQLPKSAKDIQEGGSAPLFIDPFGPNANHRVVREDSEPLSPRTLPKLDPLLLEMTQDHLNYFAEVLERNAAPPAREPRRLGLHNLRPHFVIERCTSPSCPVSPHHKHQLGLFMYDGKMNPRSQADEEINHYFGASNPPPNVWEAVDRKRAGHGRVGDRAIIEGFSKHHSFVLLERSDLQLDIDGDGMVDYGDGTPIFPPLPEGQTEPIFPLLELPEAESPN